MKTPSHDSATILLVDDEEAVQKLLTYPLEHEGFRVLHARDGEEALRRFETEQVDLVVLDLMLPKLDGLEVCRRLRTKSAVPIIMLTARDDELDKVVGLELGADDYITKPFSIREFRSRVRALLRRVSLSATEDGRDHIVVDGLALDLAKRTVELEGRRVELTYVEFELLRTLAAKSGRVYSRQALLAGALGRFRLPGAADDRRARPPPAREARRLGADPDRPGSGVPVPRLNPLRSVGARLSLALGVVVLGALAVVWVALVPTLERRLVAGRLVRAGRLGPGRDPGAGAGRREPGRDRRGFPRCRRARRLLRAARARRALPALRLVPPPLLGRRRARFGRAPGGRRAGRAAGHGLPRRRTSMRRRPSRTETATFCCFRRRFGSR